MGYSNLIDNIINAMREFAMMEEGQARPTEERKSETLREDGALQEERLCPAC